MYLCVPCQCTRYAVVVCDMHHHLVMRFPSPHESVQASRLVCLPGHSMQLLCCMLLFVSVDRAAVPAGEGMLQQAKAG